MSKKPDIIRGKVYVAGDNIDTDLIIPAKYLNLVPTIPAEYRKLGSYALSGMPDHCIPFVKKGKTRSDYVIIVAGKNFGCGSSREHAPIALGAAGCQAVVAESFARIFFRNSIATGDLYPVESRQPLTGTFTTGDEAELDIAKGTLRKLPAGAPMPLKPVGAVADVIQAGGIFGYARTMGMIRK